MGSVLRKKIKDKNSKRERIEEAMNFVRRNVVYRSRKQSELSNLYSGEIEQSEKIFTPKKDPKAVNRSSQGRSHMTVLDEIHRRIPDELWNSIPDDLSKRIDHYVYGLPKETSDP